MEVTETTKPKGFREWLAMILVRLAQKIYPESPAVTAFYIQMMQDEMIYGKSIVRIEPKGIWQKPTKTSSKQKNYPVPTVMKDPKFKKFFN